MSDYLLSDILQGILFTFFVPWTVVMIWLVFVGYRYICKLHDTIDSLTFKNDRLREENDRLKRERRSCWPSLSEENDNLRAANEVLKDDLEQCYARLPTQEWMEVLKFGESDPRRETV